MGKKGKNVDMFAPAEQFAEMLEANAEDGLSGPSTLINRDKAGTLSCYLSFSFDYLMRHME